METRRQVLRKRKAEEERDQELIQIQSIQNLNQSSDETGPRDIMISKEDQSSVNPEDKVIKQEIKTEFFEEEGVDEGKGDFFEHESSQVKFEIEEQKIVVLNEEIISSNDEDKDEVESSLDTFKEQGHSSEDLQIKSESQLLEGKDQTVTFEKVQINCYSHFLELILQF